MYEYELYHRTFYFRNLQDDFENYQQSVAKTGEDARQTQDGQPTPGEVPGPTPPAGTVCEICHKTKFADGVGNSCHYCSKRSCARCGGKVNLRSAKGSALVSILI